MDGTNFYPSTGGKHQPPRPGATALVMATGIVVLTVGILIGLAAAGSLARVADEIRIAPIAW